MASRRGVIDESKLLVRFLHFTGSDLKTCISCSICVESISVFPWFKKKRPLRTNRYGSFFKSHILGCPTIVSMDPETNRYILMNESKGLVPGYPQSMLDILGKSNTNIAAVHGSTHRHIRAALLSLLNWDNTLIDIQQKTKKMAFLSSLSQIASIEWESMSGEFMPEFFKLVLGTLSLPINFPGTNYHRGFQARKNIVSMLRRLVEKRRACQETKHDMLGLLTTRREKKSLPRNQT
ncbi:Cytochrome P450 85A1 [Camellia lanceoleosa]|uniref:Cytochrome P450 85A1 n=1 Tax=Camellia lanceoleosa TaxID=1840588 RepID=A0ACC0IK61_9ERIC|nr:Cytochrome P450 85A1 [Camellia lanceoleosa]